MHQCTHTDKENIHTHLHIHTNSITTKDNVFIMNGKNSFGNKIIEKKIVYVFEVQLNYKLKHLNTNTTQMLYTD